MTDSENTFVVRVTHRFDAQVDQIYGLNLAN
jgi:hypothetical protein